MYEKRNTLELREFWTDASRRLDELHANGGIDVLTEDGEPRAAVMSPATLDELLERLDRLETTAAIARGLEDASAGRTRPMKQAIHGLADELNLDLTTEQA